MGVARLAIYLLGLMLVVAGAFLFLARQEGGTRVPATLILAVLLLLMGIGAMASARGRGGGRGRQHP